MVITSKIVSVLFIYIKNMEEKILVNEIQDSLSRIEADYSNNSEDARKMLRIAGLSKLLYDLSKSLSSIAIMKERDNEVSVSKEILDATHFVVGELIVILNLDNKYLWPKE